MYAPGDVRFRTNLCRGRDSRDAGRFAFDRVISEDSSGKKICSCARETDLPCSSSSVISAPVSMNTRRREEVDMICDFKVVFSVWLCLFQISTPQTMPRVPYQYPQPGSNAVADQIRSRRGARGLSPLDATLLNAPAIAEGWNKLIGTLRTGNSLPGDIRELMVGINALSSISSLLLGRRY